MKYITVCILVVLMLAVGCRTVQYVPVETVKTEYKDKLIRDSIRIQDSVFVKMKGDTVWMERYKTLYRDKLIQDSVFICDSIRVPYPVETIREINRLRDWQIILMCVGSAAIVYFAFKLVRKFL